MEGNLMFNITIGKYTLQCQVGEWPHRYDQYRKNARLTEEFDVKDEKGQLGRSEEDDGSVSVLAIQSGSGSFPFLVIALRSLVNSGFHPGALLIPERDLLLVGANERLLAYDLTAVKRLWEDSTHIGFWAWERFGDVVVMSAELELAAYSIDARRLWGTMVEPPWEYSVQDGTIHLDVMGKKGHFPSQLGLVIKRQSNSFTLYIIA
jgi:hypothetical protein